VYNTLQYLFLTSRSYTSWLKRAPHHTHIHHIIYPKRKTDGYRTFNTYNHINNTVNHCIITYTNTSQHLHLRQAPSHPSPFLMRNYTARPLGLEGYPHDFFLFFCPVQNLRTARIPVPMYTANVFENFTKFFSKISMF